jgi:transmembrane sensor
MEENFTNIDELLAKKLANELNAEEEKYFNHWLSQSPENERYYADFQWVWLNMPHVEALPMRDVNTETALEKVKAQAQKPAPKAKILQMKFWIQAAAAVLIVAMAAVHFFSRNTPFKPINFTTQENVTTSSLGDGTVITLNNHSNVTILSDFTKKERRVRLQGEAFFKVAPNKEKPFVIEVSDLEVKVVGTAFNIEERNVQNTINISVTEGKVELKCKNQSEFLIANEQAVYDKTTGRITRLQQPLGNILAYKNHLFVFDALPLKAVILQLKNVYGVEIVLKNDQLGNCLLSARYDNLTIDRIADLIAETFSLRVERKDNQVTLDGKTCSE